MLNELGYLPPNGGFTFICCLLITDMFSEYMDCPWFVTTDRALAVAECGGCWVELSRLMETDTGQCVEQLDCAFYGPVDRWM